ncbi:MAG: orotidine-5'-phosphate decarboxylase [Pseudomonadaceae bacterium]|nr:orotidine-5'-phosphate decarboxylase [Pseudomonadaceae bacterium]
MTLPAAERIIVALDFPTVDEARKFVGQMGDTVSYYKVGLELIYAGGLELLQELKAAGKKVFLDAKVLDIGNTVERAVRNIAELGVDMTNIHVHDTKTVKAAVCGVQGSNTALVGVTVLTNLDNRDLDEQGIKDDLAVNNLVLKRAIMGKLAGLDGVVSSGLEASTIRNQCGRSFMIVTPGIRLPSDKIDDQERIMTPSRAIANGAHYLVVGRPITQDANPRGAFARMVADIEGR